VLLPFLDSSESSNTTGFDRIADWGYHAALELLTGLVDRGHNQNGGKHD
jgi:hypothetical protein